MFHFIEEGYGILPGFNFYRLSDPHSAGFKFRLGIRMWQVRYRKQAPSARWKFDYIKFDRAAWDQFNQGSVEAKR